MPLAWAGTGYASPLRPTRSSIASQALRQRPTWVAVALAALSGSSGHEGVGLTTVHGQRL